MKSRKKTAFKIFALALAVMMLAVTMIPFEASAAITVNKDSPLKGISVGFYGDSICAAKVENGTATESIKGWAGRVGTANAMNWVNHGVGGASVSNIRGTNTLYNQLNKTVGRYDMVILHGGTNDAWDAAPIGTMSTDFGSSKSYNPHTFAGGLEQVFALVREQNPDAIVGYIINFKFVNASSGKTISISNGDQKPTTDYLLNHMEGYVEMTKKICDKWGVPYLDLHGNDELTAKLHPKKANGQYDSTYVHDFVHPSALGYDILYPYVEEFLIDLVTPDPEPEPAPEVTEPVETPVETPVTEKTEKEKEGGCKGFTASLGATVAVISLAAVAVLSKKKK